MAHTQPWDMIVRDDDIPQFLDHCFTGDYPVDVRELMQVEVMKGVKVMPRRNDLKTILLIGSGPIIIGQACDLITLELRRVEALREDGFRVVLMNSNPATIMTDPSIADATH